MSDQHSQQERRWGKRRLWAAAVLACLIGLSQLVKSATFPHAIAEHPVRANATVTAVYINGLGGDPGVDYRYVVAGNTYTGSGDGKLGNEPLLRLHPGDPVAIEYAARAPSESCTCDAASEAPPSPTITALIAALLALPLAVLLSRWVPRWAATRHSWFAPVRGLGEWLALALGLLVAAFVIVVGVAYFIAPAVGG
jgi:hypothetical protein